MGACSSRDPEPEFLVRVVGQLAETDMDAAQATHDAVAAGGEAEAQAMHDAVAAGGEADALAAGDVAHVVLLALDDPQEYLAFDIWTDSTNIESFYSNPAFQQGVASLFEGPPTVGVYASTDWHQW